MTATAPNILLVAVNARYSHCAFAARTLKANLGRIAGSTEILETDLDITPLQLASQIVDAHPRAVGFSVYLWNVRLIEATARILRAVVPNLRLAAGGPELTADYAHAALFDAVIVGEGETAFRNVCEEWLTTVTPAHSQLQQQADRSRLPSIILMPSPEVPADLVLPYDLYTDPDLERRTVYVESSRGCPYDCAYCTSAGTGLRLIPLEHLLPAFASLWQRGLRRFKFLDRSFNAPSEHALAILDFFLGRTTPEMQLHFEINTDYLQEAIASRIAAFPKGALHLEAGLQTLNPQVASAVGRSANVKRTLDHLRFLTRQTGATVHADLIFGLPGETEASFADGFNTLIAECDPPEVQVNLLKGLPGTRLARNAKKLGLVFSPDPPYELLQSDVMDFETLTRLQRLARCWELVHNRARFPHTVKMLHASCGPDLFATYQSLATRIRTEEGKLFAIGLPRLARLLCAHLVEHGGLAHAQAERCLANDLNAKPT